MPRALAVQVEREDARHGRHRIAGAHLLRLEQIGLLLRPRLGAGAVLIGIGPGGLGNAAAADAGEESALLLEHPHGGTVDAERFRPMLTTAHDCSSRTSLAKSSRSSRGGPFRTGNRWSIASMYAFVLLIIVT